MGRESNISFHNLSIGSLGFSPLAVTVKEEEAHEKAGKQAPLAADHSASFAFGDLSSIMDDSHHGQETVNSSVSGTQYQFSMDDMSNHQEFSLGDNGEVEISTLSADVSFG